MDYKNPGVLTKLRWCLPWLVNYPIWRTRRLLSVPKGHVPVKPSVILMIANHYEPAWSPARVPLPIREQVSRVKDWCVKAKRIGSLIRDFDNVAFKHTNFYPAEQYDFDLLDLLAGLESEGLGEVEIHLHHGVKAPDTPQNLRSSLIEFRDRLAEEHRCLSLAPSDGGPRYGFVHGNSALANSAGGRWCGVDPEMQILAETGCYADFTLPSAPEESQVAKLNAIYQSGGPLHTRRPHNSGPDLKVGATPDLPVLITGPLLLDWRRRIHGIPLPRIDAGILAKNYPLDRYRFERWMNAAISVKGRPEWIFVKLSCHGFFPQDQQYCIGEPLIRSLDALINEAYRTGAFTIHFVTAREAFNIAMAAVDGKSGAVGRYRDYLLTPIRKAQRPIVQTVESALSSGPW